MILLGVHHEDDPTRVREASDHNASLPKDGVLVVEVTVPVPSVGAPVPNLGTPVVMPDILPPFGAITRSQARRFQIAL